MTAIRTALICLATASAAGCTLESASLGDDGTGGASTGGASTGGASTGGASTGGASTGGASTGGASIGGDGTGGGGFFATGGEGALVNGLEVRPERALQTSWRGLDVTITPHTPDRYQYPAGVPGVDTATFVELFYGCHTTVQPATLSIDTCRGGGDECVSITFDPVRSTGYFVDADGTLRELTGSLNVVIWGRDLAAVYATDPAAQGDATGSFNLISTDGLEPIVVEGTFSLAIQEIFRLC